MNSSDPVVRHGLARVDHTLDVPIDRADPGAGTTRVHAREVWAAARAAAEVAAEWPDDLPRALAEMVLPEAFAEVADLRPLRGAAERLARRVDWPALNDPAVLERNRVPVAAVAYADDLHVPLAFSQETAARVPNVRLWVTNELEHDGLRADGARVFARLQELRVG